MLQSDSKLSYVIKKYAASTCLQHFHTDMKRHVKKHVISSRVTTALHVSGLRF
jgi:hypothetical protein